MRGKSENGKGSVSFHINGRQYLVHADHGRFSPDSRLVDFIRDEANLKGTKWTCREGGCGACVCAVRTKDPQTGKEVVRAVNSCLVPVWSCDGWDVSTVEDLGNKRTGYHPIQQRLAHFGGTQCGFCSSGMVMNMYSLVNSKPGLSSQDVEDSFDGNICRCTGYRPILDAFKSFAVDSDPVLQQKVADIEDAVGCCKNESVNGNGTHKNGNANGNGVQKNGCAGRNSAGGCSRPCAAIDTKKNLDLILPSGERWVKAVDLQTVFDTLKSFAEDKVKYRVVAGNTGTGVFKEDGPYGAFLEINDVPQLTSQSVAQDGKIAILGGGTTLSRAIEFFGEISKTTGFEYCAQMRKHIKRVANTPVRNFGTIAGNLMMKHAHNDFPSDIFLLLETVGAKINIASSDNGLSSFSPLQFLRIDMNGKLIASISLPGRSADYFFTSFKITKRHYNAHAYVNAGFLFKVNKAHNFKILEKPSIVFGGISPTFVHAEDTENFLTGAELGDKSVLKKALQILEDEVKPNHCLPDASPQYRKSLTLSLLYKTVLRIVGAKGRLTSGALDLPRKLHRGQQTYELDEEFKKSPLYKPVTKIESVVQCSGEAEYVNDIPQQVGELSGVFVRATVANARLKSVDASEALKIPGVVKFLTAADIPGKNSFYDGYFGGPIAEVLFIENEIKASGQAIGLIVAESPQIAKAAAKLVKVEYKDLKKPILTVKQGVEKARAEGTYESLLKPPTKTADEPNADSKHKIRGKIELGSQAHFAMENHVTLCVPKEDGLTIFSATQWPDYIQGQVAKLLDIPNNSIDTKVRRLGGAYGAKITRCNQVACAAALACHVTGKPVRVVLDLEAVMEMAGKRLPYMAEYQVGFDDTGKIDSLNADILCDPGMLPFDATALFVPHYIQSCYAVNGWRINPGVFITNTHTNTYCRGPGSTEAIAIIENIMEHIADTLKIDPLQVREVNYLHPNDPILSVPGKKFQGTNLIPSMVQQLKETGDYEQRKKAVEDFNRVNRWTKRGLSMVPMRYVQGYAAFKKYAAFVGIHHQDGTVSVSHGGIEMGQGINTKVAQVVAHELGIDLSKVAVKPTENLTSINSLSTSGGVTSELACYAAVQSCKILKERMTPVKKGMEGMSWEELVKKCHTDGIDLRAMHMYGPRDGLEGYDIYGCNLVEVEVDILTGEFKIVRMDLIEDVGKSLSPEVDMGQIEGAVVMGLGLWTEEKIVFDPDTGRLLTRNTWEYKVPLHSCTPEDMRITILKNAPNPHGVLRSKAVGEPPICLAVAVLFAIRNAVKSARSDVGNHEWFQLDGPVTPEDVVRFSLTDVHSHFDLEV